MPKKGGQIGWGDEPEGDSEPGAGHVASFADAEPAEDFPDLMKKLLDKRKEKKEKKKSKREVSIKGSVRGLEVIQNLNTFLGELTASINGLITIGPKLQSFQNQFTKNAWAMNDAIREQNRLAQRNYQLDVRMADLQVKLAKRQARITMRTGRYLDVRMAQLKVEDAQRQADIARMNKFDKELKVKRDLAAATMQETLLNKQLQAMQYQVFLQTIALASAIGILAYKYIFAGLAREFATKGLMGVLTAGAAIAMIFTLLESVEGEKKVKSIPEGTAPGAQTGPGDVKLIQKGGEVVAHEGELVMRPETFGASNSVNQEININADRNTAEGIVDELVKRRLLEVDRLYSGPRSRGTI